MPVTVIWSLISLFLNVPNLLPSLENMATGQNTGDIHAASTVIDSHNDTMMHVINEDTWLPEINIGEKTTLDIDIPKLKQGGLDVAFFAAFTSGYYKNTPRSISRTLALINALYWTEKNNPDQFQIATSTLEIINTVRVGKIVAIPTIEGAYSLNEHNAVELLHQYHDLGVKVIGFNWNYSNTLGEGADRVYSDPAKTPSHGGLTDLGREVAMEMNKLGMVIDVSHMSENTFWDVLNVTKSPIMATHSGVKALKNHSRNLTDNQLKALAKNGGVIGIIFYPKFLTNEPEGYVKDIVDHIDHVVNLIGIDHVALGSDFDGAKMPSDLNDASEIYKITVELIARGYSNQDIEKILGKNTLSLLMEVGKIAVSNQDSSDASLKINPTFKMGEITSSTTPLLSAKIEATDDNTKIDASSLKVIVDGIVHKPDYDSNTSTISLKVTDPLQENFHVVTFEATSKDGKIKRETVIFYIGN